MKVIAFYLPQYHTIPENNEWWGEGFTEWTTLKKATPLYKGHYQPRIPLNNYYYDLVNDEEILHWQCRIAKENGIYGFCFYHYWFDGHMLLQKPVERYLEDIKCDLPFCICWANEDWTKSWTSEKDTVLIGQRYGKKKEWINHFNYLYRFISDKRYIKIDGKPLIVIYRPELIDCIGEMIEAWQEEAKNRGIGELAICYQHRNAETMTDKKKALFSYAIKYEPGYARFDMGKSWYRQFGNIKQIINSYLEKTLHISINLHRILKKNHKLNVINYDTVWKTLLEEHAEERYIPGAFVDWDNSPRRGRSALIISGANPQKFEEYMIKLIKKTKEEYKKDMIFIFAWNEWTEGGYLEPDTKYEYGYLHALKNALIGTNEYPW